MVETTSSSDEFELKVIVQLSYSAEKENSSLFFSHDGFREVYLKCDHDLFLDVALAERLEVDVQHPGIHRQISILRAL